MFEFLFSYGGYAPHGYCIAWDPLLIWTHVIADALVATSYFAIPALIVYFLRKRRDPSLHTPALLFALFITFCGLSHVMGIVTFYYPAYGLQGIVKMATGLISVFTGIVLIRMLPAILRIPRPADMLAALETANKEIAERQEVEVKLRQREAELHQKYEELRQATTELQEFTYAASHDLRSPSLALSNWLRGFSEDYGARLDDAGRAEVAEASLLAKRLQQMTDDVIAYSRVVAHVDHRTRPVDLNDVVQGAKASLASVIEARGAQITSTDLPVVEGHPDLLKMVIENLMSNAIKFTRPGTAPVVRIDGSLQEGGREARVTVSDNGIGIAEADRARVFTLFRRLNHADEYEGTGLGLAICRRVVTLHGGTISIAESDSGGSSFEITLPAADAALSHAA